MLDVRRSAIIAIAASVLLACCGVAFAAKSGRWSGATSQTYSGGGMPFALEVSHKKVTVIYYGADFTGSAGCANVDSPDAQRLDPNTGFKGIAIKHEKFAAKFKDAADEQISISGQFKGKTLSGSLSDSFASAGLSCSTGKVSFTAKPGGSL